MHRTEVAGSGRFIDAAWLQCQVIGALMMRELHTRYGRDNFGFLWMVVEPLFFSFGVVILWTLIHGRYQHGLPLIAFVITGYMPLTLWRHVVMRAVQCFRANGALLYHRQIRMVDLLMARIVLEFYGTIIAYTVIAFVFWSLQLYELPKDWGMFYLGWFYMTLFSIASGLIIGSVTEIYEWSEKMIGPFMYFMLPVCGAFYMVDWLPAKMQRLAVYVPTVNAFEMVRAGQFGPAVRTYYDLPYVTVVCAGLIVLGLILSRNVHRHLIIE